MSGEKRLLLIAHAFPPAGAGATQRPLKFAKFLPRHGWDVTVLTTQPGLYRDLCGLHDPSLLDEIPSEVEVLRAPSEEARIGPPPAGKLRRFLWSLGKGPDRSAVWAKRALPAALARGRREPFSAVLATAPPFSTLLLGRRVARALRVPLVADFRDVWCQCDWPPGWRPGVRARYWERRAIRASSRVIVVTGTMRRLYAQAYPGIEMRLHLIENGVDPEDMCAREPARVSREAFEIVYTGRFSWTRSPAPFLNALRLAREGSPDFAARARFIAAGGLGETEKLRESNRQLVRKLGLESAVEDRGYLAHADCARLQRNAGVLLSLVGLGRSAANSKSYEYLAAGRPVLALAPAGGEAERVLSRGVMTVLADPRDPKDAAGKLLDLFGRWERGELFDLPAPEVPEAFTRAHQAKQLAALLDAVAGKAKTKS